MFIDASDPTELPKSLARFVDLVFGNTFHTPSRDEFGMFHAQAAAFRSADLSRQVGAVISTPEGDIVAVGCNDVPKFGGGLYWTGDKPDKRDFAVGSEPNEKRVRNLIANMLERLANNGWLADDKSKRKIDDLVELALSEGPAPLLQGAQVVNLIEFGRAVHAEMASLMDAARRGVSVDGATMYTTTFPCHLCARHIVAAGIRRVVYIEPYPKSLAAQLYPDSIGVEGTSSGTNQVSFQPFVGMAPWKYMEFFSMLPRKLPDGTILYPEKLSASPRCKGSPPSYLLEEETKLAWLNNKMAEAKLVPVEESDE